MALITATWNSNELAVCLQRQCPLHAFRVLPTTCGASENQCAIPLHLLVLLTAPFSVPAPEPSCGVVKLDQAEDSYWTLVCYLHMLICTQEPGSSPGRLSQIPILGYTVLVLWATSVYGSLEESMNRCVYDRLFDNSFQKGFFHWLIVRECVKGTNTARHLPCPAARTDAIQSIV